MATDPLDVRREGRVRQPSTIDPVIPSRVVLYGDFNCPWSYLASRRAALLGGLGTDVDWRAVEHEPHDPNRSVDSRSRARFSAVHHEMDEVLAHLVPGETLPYCLAGFLPHTRAATRGYAEAYLAGVGTRVRDVLFEGFWLHALDLADSSVVRTLLVDAVRSSSAPEDGLDHWECGTHSPVSDVGEAARRLTHTWLEEWLDIGQDTVPVLQVDDAAPLLGTDAVEWLGEAVLDLQLVSSRMPPPPDARTHLDAAVRPRGESPMRSSRASDRPSTLQNA